MQTSQTLTRHPPGSVRELATLTASLILVLISTSLMGFADRLILARHSLESLEACVSALALSMPFQLPFVRIAAMTQVFIGQYHGANRPADMGACVWQMIWFSLMTMLITWPLGWAIGAPFFSGMTVEKEGFAYFQYMMAANFLFPLAAALSAFYIGRGRTKFILGATLSVQALNITLDLLLIFGIKGLLPPLGAIGAALATALSQLSLCSFLFLNFFKTQHRQTYGTENWRLRWSALWRCLKIGAPRSISSIALLTSWAAITHIMMRKGDDHLAVLSFGSTITLLILSIGSGLQQGVATAGAYAIGAKNPHLMRKLVKSAFLLLAAIAVLFAIPCLVFRETLIALFFKGEASPHLMGLLHMSCFWLWLYCIGYGMNTIGNGLLNAYGDTMFQMILNLPLSWLNAYLPVFFGIELWGWPADRLWLLMALACFVNAGIYQWRFRQEKWLTAKPLA